MQRLQRAAIAAAVAAAVCSLTGNTSQAQVLNGTQGDITVPLIPRIPAGLNGALTTTRFMSNDQLVCCENAAYNMERPDAAVNLINAGQGSWSNDPVADTVTTPVLNFSDTGQNGRFRPDDPPPNAIPNIDINNFVTYTRGTIRIPVAGDYTFNVNSDDSIVLAFPLANGGSRPFSSVAGQDPNGANGTKLIGFRTDEAATHTPQGALTFPIGRGSNDSFGTINLPAGDHPFVLLHEDGNGGGNLELSAAAGVKTAHDSSFNLVGGQARSGTAVFSGTVGPFDMVQINGDPALNPNNITGVMTRYNNNDPTGNFHRASVPTVNFHDPEGSNTGGHNPVAPFPGDSQGIDENNYGGVARSQLTISAAQAGIKTFVLYTDDGYRFQIRDGTGNPVELLSFSNADAIDDDTSGTPDTLFHETNCCSDRVARYDLAAGTYTVEAAFHEIGGGAGFFIYAADGDKPGFDDSFVLLGAPGGTFNIPAGLQLVPEPGTLGLLGVGALGLLARRRRRA